MAKTASQIKAENKERNQQIQQVIDSRNVIHQQQMAGVAEKAAARTNAVLGKALSGATDSGTKAQLKSAIQMVADGLNKAKAPAKEALPKTAQGMQKKKEDRLEAKTPIDSLQIKKDRAEKALADFDENDEVDATSAHDRKRHDEQRKRLQQEAEQANAEFAAREESRIQEQDNADIEAMSEEDRQSLEQYAVNRVRDQNLPLEMQGIMPTAEQEAGGLIGKYGKQRADELAETFMRQENAGLAKQADEAGRKFANEKPFWASAATVPINLMAGITGAVGQLQGAARATGRYRSLDANETGTALDKFSGAIREQTAQNIEGDVYDENGELVKDGGTLRKLGSLAYQGGMSFLDSTARMLASGGSSGVSSAIAATGAFSQGLQKYSAMGASPEQAALAATASAGLEYITEKLPTEQVLKIFNKGGSTNAVKEVLKQAFLVEPLGEEVNLFAGIAAEAVILGDKSGKQQMIGDLIAGGMTKEDAEKAFWKQTFMEAAETYAVSAVAGGLGAGGAAYAGNQVQTAQDQRQEMAAEPVTPAAPAPNETQLAVEDAAAALQKKPEAPAPAAPMTEKQEQLQQAIAEVTGMEGRQKLAQSEAGQNAEADLKLAEMRQLDADRAANKQRQQQVYEELKSAKSQQNDLQKQIERAEKKLRETGKGSQARIDQLKTKLEQQNSLVNQLESQNTYFTGDYERTLEEAVVRQEAVFEDARNEARKAIADHEAGLITDSQLQAAQDKYNTAGQEVYRLKHMTQEQYAAELSEVGLVGERGRIDFPTQDYTPNPDSEQRITEAFVKGWEDNKMIRNLRTPTMDELAAKRDIPIVDIGLNDEGKSYAEFRPEIKSLAEKEGWYDRPYFNNDTGMPVFITAETLNHSFSGPKRKFGEETYLALRHLPQLIKNGVLTDISDPKDPNKAEVNVYAFFAAVKGKNGVEPVKIIVKEYDNKPGNNPPKNIKSYFNSVKMNGGYNSAYDLKALEVVGVESVKKELGASASASGGNPEAKGTPNSTIKVADLLGLVKGKAEKYIPGRENAAADNLNASASNLDSSNLKIDASSDSAQAEDSRNLPPVDGHGASVSGPDYRNSNTYMNTGLQSENANIRKGYRQELRKNPDAARYEVKHNADTLAEAQRRTGSPENNAAALQDLLNRDHWTPEDVATSTLLLDEIMASGDKTTIAQLNALRQKRKEAGTYSGQVAQSFSIKNPTMKAADSPATAVDTFRSNLDGLKQEETTWNKKSGVDFENWKNQIKDDVDRIGIAIATVEDGDSDSMRQIIRQIAQRRGTTAWFGTSQYLTGNAWSVLKKLDFQDLKKVANTQLVAMADDYRARGAGEVAKGLRKQSMLSSLKTFVRNISGNVVGSFADSVSESGAGRMADAVLSKFTGKQTMGSDILRASDYAKAAREAGQFASLCVELNIPIETDVDGSYSAAAGNSGNNKYLGKTFRATGNPAMRALYAYQKYMSYALEVTDKIFEGGTNAAVAESLNRLQGANLTEEEVSALADFTGNRRTFKNATWEEDGKTKGSTLARGASKIQGDIGIVGEVAMPFVSTPMNVTQTGIDYTAGVVKGLGEMVSIIKDAKAGKTIPVERQRQAASDFGRGVTGTAMIAMFASAAAMGALKVSNSEDWDKEALSQAEGRSGAQINWSALLRGMNGEEAKWQSGDIISGMDFLEPFNTQMYLGAELSQADDFNLLTGAGATIKSVWQSLMDSPVMTGLADIEQTLNDISEAESTEDAVNVAAGYAGDVASSFVPQFVRQIAQNQDGYYRDTRGENALESAINSFMAAIPGLSEKLPVKYSGLGEAQKRGGAAETFLDPTATHEFQQNEVTTFLDELSGKVGEKANNIYPDRQAPMKFTYGDDREVTLDGPMRETYQRTYGEKVNELYTSLIHDKDFQGFSDELKIKALEEAKSYATRYAKAAVSDYREAPIGTVEALAKGIVQREVKSQMDAFFTDLDTQREYGYSTEETAAKLEESYQAFTGLSKDTQREILEQATSDTAKYLEVRQKGVTTDQFLGVTQKIDGLKPQTSYSTVRDVQKWEAIASQAGMTDKGRDALMKAYMTDYDPTDKSPDKTELRYDYARQELGLTPAQYVQVYQVQADGGKKNEKLQEWQNLGYSKEEADMFYRLFAATGKTKIDVVDWYNG